MLRPEVRHVFRTGRPTKFSLGTQRTKTRDIDNRHDLRGQRSCDAFDCPICRERNVLETPKLVEGLPTLRAITYTSFKVTGQGHQVD